MSWKAFESSLPEGVTLRVSPRASRMALRLDQTQGVVRLVVPQRASPRKADLFVREYRDWIRQKLASVPPRIGFTNGTVVPILGRDRIITIEFDPALKRTTVELLDHALLVHTNQEDPSGRILRFLKKTAEEHLTALARQKARRIERAIRIVQIRDTKSRWGSCSHDGRLSFSWRLILAPPAACDYVVAHEVAHLVHMNHGPGFWELCEKLSDDFSGGHRWMKKNGHILLQYGAK